MRTPINEIIRRVEVGTVRDARLITRRDDPLTRHDESHCWEWRTGKNYPRMKLNGVPIQVTQVLVSLSEGEYPYTAEVVDHLCRNRKCVNPGHLERVTTGENTRRGLAQFGGHRQTQCKRGHELTPENTYNWSITRGGKPRVQRACVVCYKRKDKSRKDRRRNERRPHD